MNLSALRAQLRREADPRKAKTSRSFFKEGARGAADRFLGVPTPRLRTLAKEAETLSPRDLDSLLRSRVHEERSLALILLGRRYERAASDPERKAIVDFYLGRLDLIDAWDLVDGSAPYILGPWLLDRDKAPLYTLARSPRLYRRRVAIVATWRFIREGRLADTFRLAALLLRDPEDLMHKAVGWMLREAGKRDRPALERFLRRHAARMPRTMLRYSIERFSPAERAAWLRWGGE